MKKFILICFANVLLYCANGQTFVNYGATVVVTQGCVMSVRLDNTIAGSGSLENAVPTGSTNPIFKNKGYLQIEGDFRNDQNAIADGFASNSGLYLVQGDWKNDGTFNADSSTVNLYGSSPQQITGGSITTFYNLIDSNPGVKTQTIDANVAGTFTLYDVEHATADNYLTVLNTSPAAIVENDVNTAFVSSTGNGRLSWVTNQSAEYVFPTGVTYNGSPTIREVAITPPNSTSTRTYSVRLAHDLITLDKTTPDGYDTAKKSGYIGEVNDAYYHVVNAGGNTDPATLAIFYQPGADPSWQSIGRWQGTPVEWQDLQGTAEVADARSGGISGRVKVTKSAFIPTTDTVFALVDTIAVKTDFNFPTAFVADCQTCTGTTPSDGNNGVFGIINQANIVTLQDLSVFNRWGEMVFDSKRDGTQNWNGHFNGKLAPQGNYVYRAVVTNNQTGKQYPLVTGNVALLW